MSNEKKERKSDGLNGKNCYGTAFKESI